MQNAEKPQDVPDWFTTLLDAMLLLYPSGAMRAGTTTAWWIHLRHISRPALVEGFRQAVSESPTFPPSAQTVCAAAERSIEQKRQLEARRKTEARQAQLGLLGAPPTRELAADNPFRRLAESWEYESRELGLDPERCTPKHIAERRMKELLALLDAHGVASAA
jgi:hypothetical protein